MPEIADQLFNMLKVSSPQVLKAAGNVKMGNFGMQVVKKTVGAATTVTLPAHPKGGEWAVVKDSKGDAGTNNITVVPDGSTNATTIDGGANHVINVNYGAAIYYHTGLEWALAYYSGGGGGSAAFTNVSLSGLLTESSADSLTATGSNQAGALQLTAQINRVTVGASTTGVLLPLAAPGVPIVVINSVANSIHVYGAGTDTINGIATATGIVQPPGTTYVYFTVTAAPAGKYFVYTNSPNDPEPNVVQGTLTTVGAGALLSAVIAGGNVLRTGATSAFIDTTDTGTQLAAAFAASGGIQIGQSFLFTYQNSTVATATLTGGTGVNAGATICAVGPGAWVTLLLTYTAANTFTVAPMAAGDNWVGLPFTSYSTGTTTSTFTAAQMTGGKLTIYTSTAATPGSIATPTATAMFAAIPGAYVGLKWVFRVINDVATNSLTVTADGSVTLSGKTTYVATPYGSMDFEMTFTSPTAATMRYIGGGQSTTV